MYHHHDTAIVWKSQNAYVETDWLHNTDPQLDLEHEIHASPWVRANSSSSVGCIPDFF